MDEEFIDALCLSCNTRTIYPTPEFMFIGMNIILIPCKSCCELIQFNITWHLHNDHMLQETEELYLR